MDGNLSTRITEMMLEISLTVLRSPSQYHLKLSTSKNYLKPGSHQQKCRSNIVETNGNFVACCFDIVANFGNDVKATFYFVEKTKFQRKTRSTVLPFLAKSNVTSTLLPVWTGL